MLSSVRVVGVWDETHEAIEGGQSGKWSALKVLLILISIRLVTGGSMIPMALQQEDSPVRRLHLRARIGASHTGVRHGEKELTPTYCDPTELHMNEEDQAVVRGNIGGPRPVILRRFGKLNKLP